MGEFFSAVLGFPAVVFTFMVLVVIGYWLLVLLGGADVEALDGDDDGGNDGDDDGLLGGLGLGGVPATVSLSVLIALTWFVSLVGTVLLAGLGTVAGVVLGIAVLLVAVLAGLLGTRLLVLPLRQLYPDAPEASRLDFVGRACVIRTGSVDHDFGQAEVTAADGSSAIVQVRQAGAATLTSGSSAVIYDYDADGEFFWVEPVEPVDAEKGLST